MSRLPEIPFRRSVWIVLTSLCLGLLVVVLLERGRDVTDEASGATDAASSRPQRDLAGHPSAGAGGMPSAAASPSSQPAPVGASPSQPAQIAGFRNFGVATGTAAPATSGSGAAMAAGARAGSAPSPRPADSMTVGLREQLQGVDLQDPVQRKALVTRLKSLEEARIGEVRAEAQRLGLPVRVQGPGGQVSEIVGFKDGEPLYRTTMNRNAAISTGADILRSTNSPGRGLTGQLTNGTRLRLGIWDAGWVRQTHQEFGARVLTGDSAGFFDDHATHVGGTMAAGGFQERAMGMVPAATLLTHDWNFDIAEILAVAAVAATNSSGTANTNEMPISNHSYGIISSASSMGVYETFASELDAAAFALPYYLHFASAGNNQGRLRVHGGYQSITYDKLAKNIVTVGAVEDAVLQEQRAPHKALMSQFSSWGPADDGRIKPDVVANGVTLYSPVATGNAAYDGNYSGTSMASPNASGTAAQLVQLYVQEFNALPRADLLKALLIHTADDLGNPGPDYQFGWGLINGPEAARLIAEEAASPGTTVFFNGTISNAGAATSVFTNSFFWDGRSPIRATLVWIDPEGAPIFETDSRSNNLVHNLDLRIIAPGGATNLPFVMPFVGEWTYASMGAPAIKGINVTDNVEQVEIAATNGTNGTYRLEVALTGGFQSAEAFAPTFTNTNLVVATLATNGAMVAIDQPLVRATNSSTNITVLSPASGTLRLAVTSSNILKSGQLVAKVETKSNQDFFVVLTGAGQTPPNLPPAVSLVAPTVGASYLPAQEVLFSARASDQDGIAGVEFLVNGAKKADGVWDAESGLWKASWTPPGGSEAARLLRLKARATDKNATPATSESPERIVEVYYPLPGQAVEPFLPPVADGPIWALSGDNAGRLYIGGDFTRVGGFSALRVARLDRTGAFDDAFLSVNGADGAVRTLHYSARTNALYLGGDFATVGGAPLRSLARLTAGRTGVADGTIDTNFVAPVITRSNSSSPATVRALVEQDDGRLVIGGSFTHVNGQPRANLARINADGTLDASFAPQPNGAVHALTALPDGKFYAAGAFVSLGGPTEMLVNRGFEGAYAAVSRSNATGVVRGSLPEGWTDNSLQASSKTDTAYTNTISGTKLGSALQASAANLGTNVTGARLEVGQRFAVTAGKSYHAAVWIKADQNRAVSVALKQVVAPFAVRAATNVQVGTDWQQVVVSPTLTATEELTMAVSMEGAGQITLDEASLTVAGPADYKRLVRLHPDGAIDRAFSVGTGTGGGFNGTVYSVAAGNDGSVYAGGAFSGYQGRTDYHNLVKLDATGRLLPTFNFAPGLSGEVRNVMVRPDGRILVCGSFTNVANSSLKIPAAAVGRIVQFNQDGTLDESFNSGSGVGAGTFGTGAEGGPVNIAASLANGDVLAAGGFTAFNGAPRNGLTVIAGLDPLKPVISARSFEVVNAGSALDVAFAASAPGSVPVFNLRGTLPRGLRFDSGTGRLSGVALDSGVFTVEVVANSARGTATESFQLHVGNVAVPYSAWKKAWFNAADQASDSISGPLAVHRGSRSGLPNLLVYALDGGNPVEAGEGIRPVVARERVNGADYLTLTAPKYRQADISSMRAEYSTDLSLPWQSNATVLSNTGGIFKVRAPEPATNSRLQFLRLSVTSP